MVGFFNKIVAYQELFCVLTLLESLNFYVDDEGTEKIENVIGLICKTKTLKVQHTFWLISLPPSHWCCQTSSYRIYENATIASELSEFKVSWLHCISLYVISKFCIWYITTNWKEWWARKEESFVIGTRWTKMNEKDKILVKKLSACDQHNENLYRVVSVIGRSVHQPELLRPPFFVQFFYYF